MKLVIPGVILLMSQGLCIPKMSFIHPSWFPESCALYSKEQSRLIKIAEKKENLGRKFSAGSPSIHVQIVGTTFLVKSCRL